MKVYISGKMRGMTEEESRRKFKEAELHLKALGCEVINPWDTEQEKKKHCKQWGDYILFDLKILSECDSIYMLDNWQDSWGAKCEHAFASGRGMEIIYEATPALSDKEYLDRALDFLVYLIEDPSDFCGELHEIPEENDFCAKNCENFDRFCLLRYLKYYTPKKQ